MRNGGHLLVESLVALGARKGFGIPGESYLAVLNALHDTVGKLDYVVCRNEGGASFMAAAYGKLTGEPGICFVTRGPGATNASIGVHTAMQDSSPMLLFVGQVETEMKGREAFQELDYKAVYGSMAKWAVEIDDVDRIPEIISRAWTTALNGRPGPVVIALPEDMLRAPTSKSAISGPFNLSEPAPTPESLSILHDLLGKAERPLIMYGGTNWNPESMAKLQQFAEASDIPVVSTFRYTDQYDNHSPSFVGEAGVGMTSFIKGLVRDADVILAVNNRFDEISTDGYELFECPQPVQKIVHVHGSDQEIGKVYCPELGIHAGPNAFINSLEAMGPVTGNWSEWRSAARTAYEESFKLQDQPSPVDMGKVTAYLNQTLPEDVILTNGAGNYTVWPNKFFKYGTKARLLAPQSGAMGYGLTAAVAAKVTYPERTVVCFAGDGDFQMNCQELATALQHNAQPIILIINNGIYGTIRAHQERNYPTRVSGTDMINPDFVALAQAYGFYSEQVNTTDDFPEAFQRAMESPSGAVLDLCVSAEALTPRQTLTQMRDIALSKSAL